MWHKIVIVWFQFLFTFQNSLGFLFSGCQSGIFLYIISLFLTQLFCIVLRVREITGSVDHIHVSKNF